MSNAEKMLEIKDLSVIYKTDLETVYAVNGVTFSLEKGATLGLVGETGAGKTTLALTLMRLLPERTGNLGHLTWKNPFTDEVSNESFPEVFDRALVDYECTVARFIETGDMDAVTSHVNYSGRALNADEEFDREE